MPRVTNFCVLQFAYYFDGMSCDDMTMTFAVDLTVLSTKNESICYQPAFSVRFALFDTTLASVQAMATPAPKLVTAGLKEPLHLSGNIVLSGTTNECCVPLSANRKANSHFREMATRYGGVGQSMER